MKLRSTFVGAAAIGLAIAASCSTKEPEQSTYFDRTIAPILTTSCVRTNTGAGCHVADGKGFALGNLDVSAYAGVAKRRDLLVDYGPYGQPAMLVKNVDPFQVQIASYDGSKVTITTDIKHAGGSILDPTGSAYQTLRRWIQNGATENNTGVPPSSVDRLPCSTFVPARPDFDTTEDPATPDFANFRDNVIPVISGAVVSDDGQSANCAAGNCHGTLANSLYFTCGSSPEQIRWNYLSATEYLAQTPEQSELLRRPLAPAQGGSYHEGGVIFSSPSDAGYQALLGWAAAAGPPKVDTSNAGFGFFADKVQPMLVKKGCMMVQCHSSSMFHDYRLRGGSGGSFSLSATRKNYDLSIAQLSLESDDPNASRLVRKNLYRPEACTVGGCDKPAGLLHRGGPLLEDFGDTTANPTLCDAKKYDFDNADVDTIPPYCVIAEWLKRERTARGLAPLSAVVYVKRPIGSVHKPQDFDVYAPGADLRKIGATLANGAVTAGADTSLTAGCGLSVATADIRRPQVSYDGAKVVFAARSSADEPLAVYEMNVDGSSCAKHADIDAGAPSGNGLLVHDFDPTYTPPINGESGIVFASTRGNLATDPYDYQGPQRTPANLAKPNANLYVWEVDPNNPGAHHIRQLTYLLNMERAPSFMSDGRLIFPVEKRAPNFYQIALRRMNLDGGDYHPLYAQRGSIAYPEAQSVVESSDKNFVTIMSDPSTPNGGGVLAVFNRSIGIDFHSENPADYPIDPTVIDPSAPSSPEPNFFLHSLRFPDPNVNALPGQATPDLYTSPAALPDGLILVSYGTNGDYDVYVMDPETGNKTKLFGDASGAEVDAVGVYPRAVRPVFTSTVDEPNGTVTVFPGKPEAEITVLDFRVLASLLFQNTPTGRLVDPDLNQVFVYEDLPPDVASIDQAGDKAVTDAFGKVYVRRRQLGVVPLANDGSVKFDLPGGLPIVLRLPDTNLSRQKNLPRYQREEMEFAPGEYAHQSFRADFFDALCGQCHGSISGRPVDVALLPDFVTQASATVARGQAPFQMNKPPSERGPIEGPPPGP